MQWLKYTWSTVYSPKDLSPYSLRNSATSFCFSGTTRYIVSFKLCKSKRSMYTVEWLIGDEGNRNESTNSSLIIENITINVKLMQDIVNENYIPNFLTALTEALSNCQSVPVGPFARGTTAHRYKRPI